MNLLKYGAVKNHTKIPKIEAKIVSLPPTKIIYIMRKLLLIITCLAFLNFAKADEGMWIPLFLKYNEAEMQQLGFKLTAEDVYSVNKHSMKDAIVLFGRGCTAELISPEGLILTNHHCGYSYVQSHSTMENNYLHNGFWAKSKSEEIANPGLTVTFLVRMEEVTTAVLKGVTEKLSATEREKVIQNNINQITKKATKGTHYTAIIKPFYYGNQYFMFVNEVFKDVRLVGTPPESIGKFGGDTDNWMWPRHTGDFSLYRIYTDKDGKPADYSPNNIPLKSKQYFKISTKGVNENDFTLVFGYPGTTRQFLISDAVKLITEKQNPVAIHQRGNRLDVMKKYMDESLEIRLLYSAKTASISNGWKKWIGENKGLSETKAIEKKMKEEEAFQQWVNSDSKRKAAYGSLLADMKKQYSVYAPLLSKQIYFSETFPATELIGFAYSHVYPLVVQTQAVPFSQTAFDEAKKKLENEINPFFSKYHKPIDKDVFVELLHYYFSTINADYIPASLKQYKDISKSNLQAMANEIYDNSPFVDEKTFSSFIVKATKEDIAKLGTSDFFKLFLPAYEQYFPNREKLQEVESQINLLYKTYVKALMEKDGATKTFYPDANLTMRVTYGQVKGFFNDEGVEYQYYTTLDGVIEKENPDIFDYIVDSKLKAIHAVKDYGPYANEKGELPVAFIASNHTTGGNSGSPVINGDGELIGLNFDRAWEGTMSDINYDVSRCRNISMDARYILFIIDKFANAQNIINELTIVGNNTERNTVRGRR